MDRDKSLIRAKKSAITIADVLAKEGLAGVIPCGGILYDTAKALLNHGRAYYTDRTENRMKEFHSALLSGKASENEFLGFIKKPFDIDDYYAVLFSCVQDIENEKVEIYSTLMSSLIEGALVN